MKGQAFFYIQSYTKEALFLIVPTYDWVFVLTAFHTIVYQAFGLRILEKTMAEAADGNQCCQYGYDFQCGRCAIRN